MTDVMEPNSCARVAASTSGRCTASRPGISLVQIAPAVPVAIVIVSQPSPTQLKAEKKKEKGGGLTDGVADGAADLGPGEGDGGRDGEVGMGDGGLRGDGGGEDAEPAAEALEDLRPDDLGVGRVRVARVDHQAHAAVA